jgi:SAM-dependent methyltransferase
MTPDLRSHFENHGYPPMSHPLSDPAVTSVAARLAGLRTPHPASARILEIGCASGHNLLPLAERWPDTSFTGIDLSPAAIQTASGLAAASGLHNARFITADLADFSPADGPFDFILVHGVFSWVPDATKQSLLDFCRRHLSPSGTACISFNVAAGWESRLPIIARARQLMESRQIGRIEALQALHDDPSSAHIRPILADMLAKGPDILAYDDFAPVNDPWPLERFVAAASSSGLRWLGESAPAENFPAALSASDRQTLLESGEDPLTIQSAIDHLTGRTFRSALLCRADAPMAEKISTAVVLEFALRSTPATRAGTPLTRILRSFAPSCVAVTELAGHLGSPDVPGLAREIFQSITAGSLEARIEPVLLNPAAPEKPTLSPLRQQCARLRLPLVDVWHRPCTFPAHQHSLLEKLDGQHSLSRLAAIAHETCPGMDFQAWIDHLASRGMFT